MKNFLKSALIFLFLQSTASFAQLSFSDGGAVNYARLAAISLVIIAFLILVAWAAFVGVGIFGGRKEWTDLMAPIGAIILLVVISVAAVSGLSAVKSNINSLS